MIRSYSRPNHFITMGWSVIARTGLMDLRVRPALDDQTRAVPHPIGESTFQ